MQIKETGMPSGFAANPDLQKVIDQNPERVEPLLNRIKNAIAVSSAVVDVCTQEGAGPYNDEMISKMRSCSMQVAAVFPDIHPKYMALIAKFGDYKPEKVITSVIDFKKDAGADYIKKDHLPEQVSRDQLADQKAIIDHIVGNKYPDLKTLEKAYDNPHRRAIGKSTVEIGVSLAIIRREFPVLPRLVAHKLLAENDDLLLPTYLAIEQCLHGADTKEIKPWNLNFKESDLPTYSPDEEPTIPSLFAADCYANDPFVKGLLPELQAARIIRANRDEKRKLNAKELVYDANVVVEAPGTEEMEMCESCLDSRPTKVMIRCNSKDNHFFCSTCVRHYAEKALEDGKEFKCVSNLGCEADFSRNDLAKVLSEDQMVKFDRTELDNVLVNANIKNMEVCAFCDFVAQYPKVNTLGVFTCLNPKCRKKTCRLCRCEAHGGNECGAAILKRKADNIEDTMEVDE